LKKADLLSTLNQPGAVELAKRLAEILRSRKNLAQRVAALESTLFYGIQAANHLSSCEVLTPFHTVVYGLNPKTIKTTSNRLLTSARTTMSMRVCHRLILHTALDL